MRPLSATEAISPAIEHTKAMLRPFSFGLWLKLGFVAIFAEMGGQFMAPPMGNFPHHGSSQTSGIGAVAGGFTPVLVAVLVGVAIVGLLIGLALLYLGSRLQLVLMDLVATRTTFVASAWHRTAPRTWRWIGGKVACFLILFACVAGIAAGPIVYFIHATSAGNGTQPGAAFIGTFALFFVAIFFVVIILMLAIWLLRDFVLPFILFEDASFADALRRAAALIRNEPGPVFFYLFMKIVLSIAAGIVCELCILVVALIAAIPTALAGFVLWSTLHNSGPLETVLMYISFALLAVIFLAALLVAILCLGGVVLIFYQAYALYFLGGRIPQIGTLLEPPPPPFYPSMPLVQAG